MGKRSKKGLSIVIAIMLIFAIALPAAAAPTVNRVEGRNAVFLGYAQPGFVLFADGQIVTQQNGQTGVIVWTPDGTGDWDQIKAAIFAAGQDPGWLYDGYEFVAFFDGVGRAYYFHGGQNHYFWVEYTEGRWYAFKSGGTISNTIFYGDLTGSQPPSGTLDVVVGATQRVYTVTEVAIMQRVITPTQTIRQYVSRSFSSVTATTPDQWALRNCPNVINVRNGNPIHPNGNGANYNPLVVRNSNHFTFASLPHAQLAAGEAIELVLVVGNNFNEIGNATVTYAGGYLTITFEYELFTGSWGALSFNDMRGAPNNGNIHSIGGNVNNTRNAMIALGAPTHTAFSHNIRTNTVTIPAAAPTAAGNVYLYIHGTFTFDLGRVYGDVVYVETYSQVGTETVTTYVVNTINTAEAVVTVYDSNGVEVARGVGGLPETTLPVGEYTVRISFAGQVIYEQAVVVVNYAVSVNASFTLPALTENATDEYWLPDIIRDIVVTTVVIRR